MHGVYDFSYVIDIQLDFPPLSFQRGIHGFFNPCFSNSIGLAVVFFLFLIKGVILIFGNLPCVADDVGKTFAVVIPADGFLLNVHALEGVHVFHDICHCLIRNLLGDSSCDILLVAVKAHGIPDVDKLKDSFFCHLILVNAVPVLFVCAEIIYNVRGRMVLLRFRQFIDSQLSVDIRNETQPLGIGLRHKSIIIVAVQYNSEIVDHSVVILLDDVDHRAHDLVKLPVLLLPVFIFAVILNCDSICQLVVGEQFPVAVVDVAPRSFHILRLLDLELIIIKILLPFYNLKIKYLLDKDAGSDAEQKDYDDNPRLHNL